MARARMGEAGPAIDLLNRALRGYEDERHTSFLQALEVTGELGRQSAASRPLSLLAHLHRYLRIFDPSQGRVAVRRAKEAIARGDRPSDAYLTIGVIYEKHGYPDDALAALKQAVETDGRNAEALRWTAHLYRQRGDLVNEYQMVKRAYEAAPNGPYYIGHFGDVLINRLGDLHQAKAVWERAVAEAPDNAVALAQLGRVEHYLGHYARAVSLLETAFRLDPASSMTRWLLGYALLDAGRPDDAVRLFQDWVAKAPGNPTAHTNLGVVYGRARRGREAIAELEKAYQLGERSSTSTSTSASSTSTRPPISSARSSASASSSGGSPGGPGRSSCCPRSRRTSGSPRRASDEGRLARRLPQARARERPRLLGALGPDDLPRAEPTALRIST